MATLAIDEKWNMSFGIGSWRQNIKSNSIHVPAVGNNTNIHIVCDVNINMHGL